MADAATKHLSFNGGIIVSDLKSLSLLLKTRKTLAFAYGFGFAFVAFTVFLAFVPSPNSSSPWFTNIFSSSSVTSSSDSYRSQFSSIFSYFLPNSSSPRLQVHDISTLPAQNITRSNTTLSQPSGRNGEVRNQPTVQNKTQNKADSVHSLVLKANQSDNASIVNELPSTVENHSQGKENSNKDQALKPNQTTISPPIRPPPANSPVSPVPETKVANSSINSVPAAPAIHNGNANASTASASSANKASNFTASLLKKESNGLKQKNGTNSEAPMKQGIESLLNCDLFDGEWVRDDSYPLYKPGSCSLIDEQFNCIHNGRPDKDYQKYKWKPKGCSLPRLNPANMLDMLRGKRLVFVGDSLNRNMWESLVCILKSSVKDQSKVFEANGRHHFRGEASYSFIFKDYNCTVEFFVSPFLVQEWEMPDKNGTKKETLRLDLVGRSSDLYKRADIIIFNTGHWWTHEKTSKGKDYYQEGSHVYDELNVLEAFRKALTTWARWVDANINPTKSVVFFRGYSASHFSVDTVLYGILHGVSKHRSLNFRFICPNFLFRKLIDMQPSLTPVSEFK
ncbi:protein trichome birefringence isoform X2 [Manihot esculenta]|uniref:protein trichome birefringence isoform X2 n=1 Tax=Manihot esculenta TaxID=3983 RepID=UPI001CC399A1|nr:protein trichome birefringence isoform X2 [Manihot esculenta]